MSPFLITATTPGSADALALMAALDEELLRQYPPEHVHRLTPEEQKVFAGVFLIIYLGRAPIA